MQRTKLVGCLNCFSIFDVICNIDKKLSETGSVYINNQKYEINRPYNRKNIKKLIRYKEILKKKLYNPSYTGYTQSVLVSRINKLINGL